MRGDTEVQILVTISSVTGFQPHGFELWVLPNDFSYNFTTEVFFFSLRLPLKQKKRLLNLLTTLSYLTSCFAAQKLHKQTVRHVCWLACVFCTHI